MYDHDSNDIIDIFDYIDNNDEIDNWYKIDEIQLDESENKTTYGSKEYCKNKCGFFNSCYENTGFCIKKVVLDKLEQMAPQKVKLLKLRYGWYKNHSWTIEEIAKKFELRESYVALLLKDIIGDLRSPYYLVEFRPFLYDVFVSSNEFFKNLFKDIFSEEEINRTLFALNMGIDLAILYEGESSSVAAKDVLRYISTDINDIDFCFPYLESFNSFNITTLDHLLHTSIKLLYEDIFKFNDVQFFSFIKDLNNNGYKLKDSNLQQLESFLSKELASIFIQQLPYDELLTGLPLNLAFELFEQDIKTIEDLIDSYTFGFKYPVLIDESKMAMIKEYLFSLGLIININNRPVCLTKSFLDRICKLIVTEFIAKSYSLNCLKNEIGSLKKPTIENLFEIITNKFPKLAKGGVFPNIPSFPIETLNLSSRPYNCLKNAKIQIIEELTQKTENDILKIRHLGRRSLDEIIRKLKILGFSLREE